MAEFFLPPLFEAPVRGTPGWNLASEN